MVDSPSDLPHAGCHPLLPMYTVPACPGADQDGVNVLLWSHLFGLCLDSSCGLVFLPGLALSCVRCIFFFFFPVVLIDIRSSYRDSLAFCPIVYTILGTLFSFYIAYIFNTTYVISTHREMFNRGDGSSGSVSGSPVKARALDFAVVGMK
jgi:hypothetical protein